MTATEQWIFLCAAHKTPKECPALDYTRHTLDEVALRHFLTAINTFLAGWPSRSHRSRSLVLFVEEFIEYFLTLITITDGCMMSL
ncbi:MOB phocein isoform X2, partial [Paramuricea clavata]